MTGMKELLDTFLDWLLTVLPVSPFRAFIDACSDLPYLGWLNWFVPIGQMIAIGELWLTAIALYYMYSIIARWIRAIQ